MRQHSSSSTESSTAFITKCLVRAARHFVHVTCLLADIILDMFPDVLSVWVMAAMPAAAKCAVTSHLEVTCLLADIILDLFPEVLLVVGHGGYARSSQVRCDQPFGSDLFTGVDNP